MSRSVLIRFLAILLAVSWLVQGLAIFFVRDLNSPSATPWLIAMMFFPTVGLLIYRFGFNKRAFAGVRFGPGNLLYLVPAALIPALIALVVVAIVQLAGWGTCEFFQFSKAGVDLQKGPWVLGVGGHSWLMFIVNVAATAILYSLINGVVAVGEEFAWRGVLQPHMIGHFGVLGGIALLGLVWACWHLPANLSGYNYPHTPVLGGLVLFPALLVADSFIMAWLTLRARSFWPAVIMHGSGNGIQEGILSKINLSEGVSRIYVDVAAIGVTWVLAAICIMVLWRNRRHAANSGNSFLLQRDLS